MDTQVWRREKPGGSIWLLLGLAAAPFVANSIVVGSGATGYGWQLVYKSLLLAAPVYWRFWFGGRRGLACVWPVDEPRPDAATWAIGASVALALAGSAICSILALAPTLDLDPDTLRADLDQRFELTKTSAALIVVYLFSINAALEELHFRAWLDRELSVRWGAPAGIVISAAAFGAMHFFVFAGMAGATAGVMTLMFLSLFLAGASWSLIARRPGGIHAAWLSHGLTNVGLMTWGLFWLGYF